MRESVETPAWETLTQAACAPRTPPRPRPLAWIPPVLVSVAVHTLLIYGLRQCAVLGRETHSSAEPNGNTASFVEQDIFSTGDGSDEGFGTLIVAGAAELQAPPEPTPTTPSEPANSTGAEKPASQSLPAGDPAGAGRGSSSGPGKGHFFRIPANGKRIVYLIDASASMGQNGRWWTASRELLASLQSLPADARFRVVVYNSTPQLLLPRLSDWLPPEPVVLDMVADALRTLPIEGRTDHVPALRHALAFGPEVLFFLTDADDLQPEDVRQIELVNRGRTVIHTIELSAANRQRPGMPLQQMARGNRGVYQAIDLGQQQ